MTAQAAGVADSIHRKFPCEQCGADLVFSIGAQKLKCEFCSFEKDLTLAADAVVREQDLKATFARLSSQRQKGAVATPELSEIKCEACHATIVFQGTLTSQNCAYCGAPVQRDKVHRAAERIPVDAVLTFQVEEGSAKEKLRAWVKSRWFAPNAWKRAGLGTGADAGRFQGVYLPYFSYDAMTANQYRGQRGDAYYVTVGSGKNQRQERRVRWSSASGSFQRFFDDVLTPALSDFPKKLLETLEPWPLSKVRPFAAEALAGKLAHTYNVELEASFEYAKQRITDELRADVRQRIGGDEQRIEHLATRYDGLTYKHLLLPIWLLAYRYSGKTYRVVVNACTGEVQGERPYSPWKIAFAVVVGAIVAGVLVYLGNQNGS